MENGSKVMFKDFVWMKAHNKVFVGMRDLKGLMFQNVVQKQEEHCDTLCVMLKHSRLKARKMRFKEFVWDGERFKDFVQRLGMKVQKSLRWRRMMLFKYLGFRFCLG